MNVGCTLLVVVLMMLTISAGQEVQEPVDARQAISARLEAMKNIDVEYELSSLSFDTLDNPATQPARLGTVIIPLSPKRESKMFFSYSHGTGRWETDSSADEVRFQQQMRVKPIEKLISTSDGHSLETLAVSSNRKAGSIVSMQKMPGATVIELGLGLRVGERMVDSWMTEQQVLTMSLSTDRNGRIVLSRQFNENQSLEWTFDPNLGYALVAYQRLLGVGRRLIVDVEASDFRTVEGVPLPFQVLYHYYLTDGKERYRKQAKVTEYTLGDGEGKILHVAFPKGASVFDERTGDRFRVRKDGQILTDEVIVKATKLGPEAQGDLPLLLAQPTPKYQPARRREGLFVGTLITILGAGVAVLLYIAKRRPIPSSVG